MIAFFNGQYTDKQSIGVSPDDRGFLFGEGVYEVIRSYNGFLFAADLHLNRLRRSADELSIQCPEIADLKTVAVRLIETNNLKDSDATIYIQITRGAAKRSHTFPSPDTEPTVYISASPFQTNRQQQEDGICVTLIPDIRWSRCDIKSVSLLPNVLGSQSAREYNAAEAVFVRDNTITEGTHTNAFCVSGGTVITYPESNYILPGITRKVAIDLCHQLDIPVIQYPVQKEAFLISDEVFLTGTTLEITPVIQVGHTVIADKKPGPVVRRLQEAFRNRTTESL